MVAIRRVLEIIRCWAVTVPGDEVTRWCGASDDTMTGGGDGGEIGKRRVAAWARR
jgi:hypothetical protein